MDVAETLQQLATAANSARAVAGSVLVDTMTVVDKVMQDGQQTVPVQMGAIAGGGAASLAAFGALFGGQISKNRSTKVCSAHSCSAEGEA